MTKRVPLAERILYRIIGCPRVKRGYNCHAHYKNGCEACGRKTDSTKIKGGEVRPTATAVYLPAVKPSRRKTS